MKDLMFIKIDSTLRFKDCWVGGSWGGIGTNFDFVGEELFLGGGGGGGGNRGKVMFMTLYRAAVRRMLRMPVI
jgi:hypothetical protein